MKAAQYFISGILFSLAGLAYGEQPTAPVSGFARSFLSERPIPDGTVTILETGQKFQTNLQGEFGPFNYPVGKSLTLEFSGQGYQTTQSETVMVPKEGLTGKYSNITFQVPSLIVYYALAKIIGATIDDNACHVTTTITALHKTLDDIPQGEAEAKITLSPSVESEPFYFDIFSQWFLKGKTNPFTRGLKATTLDGGVAFFNLPPSSKLYTLSAKKEGKAFTTVQFWCRKGAFINISPPRGPSIK